MIEEKQIEIINKINDLDIVKQIKVDKNILDKNNKYNKLIKDFSNNLEDKSKIIEIRKKLFEINEFREYMKLQTELRINFIKINAIIVSIVNRHSCKL